MQENKIKDYILTMRQKLKLGTPPEIIVESMNSFMKLHQLIPSYDIYYLLGESHSLKKDFKEAVFFFTKALQYQQTSEIYHSLGNEYFQKGIYKQAVLFMQKALSLDAENQEAISLLGKIFIVTGKKDEVFKLMRRLEQNSSVNGLQALQGFKSQMIKQFLKNKMYQDAYQMAKKEIDQNRGNHAHYEALGISLLQMGRHRAALDFLEKSRNLNPKAAKYPMPSFEEKKKELGDISQKITQLENTLVHRDSQTQDSESHFDLGFLYFYNGEHKKALHSFKSALDLKLRAI